MGRASVLRAAVVGIFAVLTSRRDTHRVDARRTTARRTCARGTDANIDITYYVL